MQPMVGDTHVTTLSGPRHQARIRQQRLALPTSHQTPLEPNIQKKRYWVPSLGRKVTLTLTPKAIKEIDRRGVDIVVAEMLTRGEKI